MSEKVDFSKLTSSDETLVSLDRTYGANNFYVTIRLSDLVDARYIEELNEDTGEYEKGIFIPIESNSINITDTKKALITFRAEVSEIPSNKYSHVIFQMFHGNNAEERKRLGFSLSPIVGFMRPLNFKGKKVINIKHRPKK